MAMWDRFFSPADVFRDVIGQQQSTALLRDPVGYYNKEYIKNNMQYEQKGNNSSFNMTL